MNDKHAEVEALIAKFEKHLHLPAFRQCRVSKREQRVLIFVLKEKNRAENAET